MTTYETVRYKTRRTKLTELVQQKYGTNGKIVLFAGFERDCIPFRQESSFYYYTGLTEPGLVLAIDLQGATTLYIPQCSEREKWMLSLMELSQENAHILGVDHVDYLGDRCAGYQFHPFFPAHEYKNIIDLFTSCSQENTPLFTLSPANAYQYADQRLILERLKQFVPGAASSITDISELVAQMRRKKETYEIECLYKAIEITALAQETAAATTAHDVNECQVHASLEYIMTGSCSRPAFPSIVAAGRNSTILHYHHNNTAMKSGDLLIVDIGAEYEYYCADITRTYPVSGTFNKRQREIYNLVLETQLYIADCAKPGFWLSNKEYPEQSLNHLAKKYLKERGYDRYFPHGIGHFLGLDVHDVGTSDPLAPGDVITIEPGIYIPEENYGVRIEDDYWIVEDGAVCLSENIAKLPEDIEALMKQKL